VTRFQLKLRCTDCGTRYKRVVEVADDQNVSDVPDPPCPTCSKVHKTKVPAFKFGTGKAPAVGGSLVVKAVDTTAQIVMEDHGMTDLRSDVREGESMAPKLPPRQQAMADNFFARPKNQRRMRGGIFDLPPRAVMQSAVNGRFQTPDTINPIAIHHARRESAPVRIVGGDGVKGN